MIEKDTSAYSAARKKYWSTLTQQERSDHARKMAQAKSQNMSFEEKRQHSLMMVKARKERPLPSA
jgi:acyl-CoA reductase-like NAD-dependent aldehyde dehydrogenase